MRTGPPTRITRCAVDVVRDELIANQSGHREGLMARYSPQGLHPCTRPLSLCFAKEKGGKRKATPDAYAPGCARGSLRCSGLGGGAERASLASSLRLNGRAESVHVARCARSPKPLRCSAWHRGPPKQPTAEQPGLHPAAPFPGVPYALPRSTATEGVRASALPLLARGGRSNAVSAANGVRSAPCPQARAPVAGHQQPMRAVDVCRRTAPLALAAGTPAAGWGCASGSPFFAYFLRRSEESRSAAGPKSRRALSNRKDMH
ncbi:hypothetical protein HNQ51_002060 [Inhella inkyongensis]|uniref:Uncharacterized protein n=1 Tax=Inhella inkyongensis TaxID=392593 RepID=A0A840S6X4_9BURK|nr:hypothetical protein [Inhella inkyongensis]